VTGIREMFAELTNSEEDWYHLCFAFERADEIRRERHRESQRVIDLRKRIAAGRLGKCYGKRGRPSLGLTAEQMRERRKERNQRYYEQRRAA
jgi:hypothetical protein